MDGDHEYPHSLGCVGDIHLASDPLALYERMYLIRRTEEEIVARYPKGLMKTPVHLSIGQEHVAVGICSALQPGDVVYSTHRCHAHYLAKGGDLYRMVAELHGKAAGCCGGMGGSMHLVDESVGFMGAHPIVGSSISLAVGHAMAFKRKKLPNIAVAFGGDATPDTGQYWEALSFAKSQRLPLLIVLELNGYATATPRPPQSQEIRYAYFLDLSYRDASPWNIVEHVGELRRGLPSVLMVQTYRYYDHVGVTHGWDGEYRLREKVEKIMAYDFLTLMHKYLLPSDRSLVEASVSDHVMDAFDRAESAAYPTNARHAYAGNGQTHWASQTRGQI